MEQEYQALPTSNGLLYARDNIQAAVLVTSKSVSGGAGRGPEARRSYPAPEGTGTWGDIMASCHFWYHYHHDSDLYCGTLSNIKIRSVVVNTQCRESPEVPGSRLARVWYPRRRPCGVAINALVVVWPLTINVAGEIPRLQPREDLQRAESKKK